MIGSMFRIFTRPAKQWGVAGGRVCTFTTFLPTILLRDAAVARLDRGRLLPLLPGSQSDASVHRPLSLGDDSDKGRSAAASDRCLRATVGVFVLKAYICALNLRSCFIHPMDADDGESTQKMRGRCKTLEHHDRAAARLEPIRHTRKPRKR